MWQPEQAPGADRSTESSSRRSRALAARHPLFEQNRFPDFGVRPFVDTGPPQWEQVRRISEVMTGGYQSCDAKLV